MVSTSVHNLRVNPAQMRTRVGFIELARLAVQVKNGIDPSLALVLGPYDRVISGHRRWLALMIAHIAYASAESLPINAEQDLELMAATIEELCTVQDGFVLLNEELYKTLQNLVPKTLTVPYRLWEGSTDEEILLLIKANTGAEEPDLVGQARAFKAAIAEKVSYATLSQVTGQPGGRLEAMVKLLDLPQIFQDLVNDALLDLSVVLDLAPLKSKAIKALGHALAVRHAADRKEAKAEGFDLHDYTSRVRLAVVQMDVEPVIPNHKDVGPETHNLCRAVGALWALAAESVPGKLYQVIAAQGLEGTRIKGNNRYLDVLADISDLKDYLSITEGAWGQKEVILPSEAIMRLLPEIDCSTCAFIDLPPERVKHELPFACREKPSGVAAGPCPHWAPKGKRFFMRTPYHWTHGGKQVTSFDELRDAWQAQWDREHAKKPDDGLISGKAESMEEQRANIRFYMERHTQPQFMVEHPWATPCLRCAHLLEGSPVKSDPDAPHCTWAKGRRRLQFRAYVPADGTIVAKLGKVIPEGQGLVPFDQWEDWEPSEIPSIIPSCMQFEPSDEWAAIVPEADVQPPYPREVMVSMINAMADSINRNVYSTDSRGALQFLTGRPLSASASHRKTFPSRFKKEEPMLSELQLWTLLQWLLLEWLRVHHHTTIQKVPMGGGQVLVTNPIYFSTALELKAEEKEEE